MRKLTITSLAVLAAVSPLSATAQDKAVINVDLEELARKDRAAAEDESQAAMEQVAAMMAGMFQSEPLTAEQEERLPAARSVVGAMMPDGFYGEMMSRMMDKMLRPMMGMFTQPEFVLASRLEVEADTIAALEDDEKRELMLLLDPAFDQRIDVLIEVLTGKMGTAFAVMEDPMRDGLSNAYAVRFDDDQLADIGAFFATETGRVYAAESMALFSDPQVIGASMKAMPAMMSGFGDMEVAMKEAMEQLPAERSYDDLDASQRERLAQLLEVDASDLPEIVKPPKPMDGSTED